MAHISAAKVPRKDGADAERILKAVMDFGEGQIRRHDFASDEEAVHAGAGIFGTHGPEAVPVIQPVEIPWGTKLLDLTAGCIHSHAVKGDEQERIAVAEDRKSVV